MYQNGYGVKTDSAEAAKWYRRAADQGDYRAQANLGAMYESGHGMAKNKIQAYMWYMLASEAKDAEAARKLRDKLEPELTQDEIAQATKLAKYVKAAETQQQ